MKTKPIIRWNETVKLFTRDNVAITDEQAGEHWKAMNADWSQGAYREMATRVLNHKEAA